MKQLQLILITVLLSATCKSQSAMDNANFKAEKVSKTASFTVNGEIGIVFPLYGAFDERKWVTGWNPILIYPSEEIIEEGATFKTKGKGDEPEYLWRVTKFEAKKHLVQYLVSTENRYWTITVRSEERPGSKTFSEVTYSFIGLNQLGNELNKKALAEMYAHDLKDWKEALEYYLETGKSL